MKRTKEKEAIMKVLQSYGLKQANLTSDFAREQIADDDKKSSAKSTAFASTSPPPTVPELKPSPVPSILPPCARGTLPLISTKVTVTKGVPASSKICIC